jgi:fatty acid desaturase
MVPQELQPVNATVNHEQLLALLERYGRNLHSFMVLEPGLSIWLSEDAAVAYTKRGGYWVAVGSPLCSPENSLAIAASFTADAKRAGCAAVFFGVSQPFVDRLANGRFDAMQIGLSASWLPSQWDSVCRKAPKLRNRLNKSQRDGIACRSLSPSEINEDSPMRSPLVALANAWAQSKSLPPMGFMVTLELFQHADRRRYVIAEHKGKLCGLSVCIPVYGRNGWLLEDMLLDPNAPGGVSESLIDFAMRQLALEKAEFVSLGLVALAGLKNSDSEKKHPYLSLLLRTCSTTMGWLYNFEGLYRFRNKMKPTCWEPVYIVASGPVSFWTIRAILMAFAQGWVPRFGLRVVGHWYTKFGSRDSKLPTKPPAIKPRIDLRTFFLATVAISTLFIAVVGQYLNWLPTAVAMILGTFAAYIGFTPVHEAVHGNVSRYRRLNDLVGHACSLLLLGAFRPYCYLHQQHHLHTNNEPADPDFWCAQGPKWLLPIRWATQDIGYLRFYFSRWSMRPRPERLGLILIGLAYLSLAIITLVFSQELFLALLTGWFIPARLALFFLAATFSWLPHAPHDEQSPYRATSVRSSRWLTYFLLGQNFHLVHHLNPGIPFHRLPGAWQQQREEIIAQGGIDRTR